MDISKAYQLIVDKLFSWMDGFVRMLPNIFLATLILVLGFFIAKRLKKVAARFIKKMVVNVTLHNLLISIVYVFLLGIVIFFCPKRT